MAGKETMGARNQTALQERPLADRLKEIQELYTQDDRPWIVGYSGGKDSSATLQLIWQAISQLPLKDRTKPVHVLSSDTLVEAPGIADHVDKNLAAITDAAAKLNLPFTTTKVVPETNQTFWVNLIGRGYPAPMQSFRWCTDRMKIKPADRFIMETVSKHGEVVVALGIRKGESMSRDQLMAMYKIRGTVLQKHSKFPRAYVYAPIQDWTVDDVWSYLLQVPSPWGVENRDLAALYRLADGECPLVVDATTPSCGNSRFGCWTCTVVQRNKSMEAMIDNGEHWMEPLLEFRDYLAETQDPERKKEVRDYRRLDGRVLKITNANNKGKLARGPYTLEFCKELLRRLLDTQTKVREKGPDPEIDLISMPELNEIRRVWRLRRGDWEDSVPRIYAEATGDTSVEWPIDALGGASGLELKVLQKLADAADLPLRLLTKLIDTERQSQGMKRRHAIYSNIEGVLREDWRSEDKVLRDLEKELAEQKERETKGDAGVAG